MDRDEIFDAHGGFGTAAPSGPPGVDALIARIVRRDVRIAIVGLGYIGVPLAIAACRSGFGVTGFDVDAERVDRVNRGQSYINHIPARLIADMVDSGRFEATTDPARLGAADAIVIAVPTPLTRNREPDLSYVESAARTIAGQLRPHQLVVLESTTWPGTTDELVRPILEAGGLKSGRDFYLAFSPEREDPGNSDFQTSAIPKVVGGDGAEALAVASALYAGLVVRIVPVSSTATAEAVKLTENIFRAVNIALVNEMKVIYERMGIDVWDVIDAAKTKPFGFMPFYPGPGLGGHCIPVDPFYLTWKAREYDIETKFIELAGQINKSMPVYVVDRLAEALDRSAGRGLKEARVLVMGVAYKKNIDDMRESPSLRLIELLRHRLARVDYHDPFVPVIPPMREHPTLAGMACVPVTPADVAAYDVVLIATDHDAVDYRALARDARLVVDTRNACHKAGAVGNIVKA